MSKELTAAQSKLVYFVSFLLIIAIAFVSYYRYFGPNSMRGGIFALDKEVTQNEYDIVFGHDTASQVLYLYSNYNCHFCKKFFEEAYPLLKKEYLDKGKLKLVLKLVDRSTNDRSLKAMQLAMCSYSSGYYENIHELLVHNSDTMYSSQFSVIVDDILNENIEIAQCFIEGRSEQAIMQNNEDYKNYNLTGTPSFIFNGMVITGYADYRIFKKLINKYK